jgi:hypothetical protein
MVAAAREAVRLGYGIVPDDGPSGRLGQWAIAGVAPEAMAVHSKRAAEITAETQRRGFDSYRARGIVARDIRAPKRHEPVADLMSRCRRSWNRSAGRWASWSARWSPPAPAAAVPECRGTTTAGASWPRFCPAAGVRGVDGAAGAVDGLVLGLGAGAHQAEGSGAGAAPDQRRLAPRCVVGQGLAGVVVGPVQDRVAVVGHRVRTDHPHPRHGLPKPQA